MLNNQISQRISIDPRVMAGKPVNHGTRIPVALIVRMLGQGITEETILDEYPNLVKEDIRSALMYAADVLAEDDVYPLVASPSQ